MKLIERIAWGIIKALWYLFAILGLLVALTCVFYVFIAAADYECQRNQLVL